MNPRPLSYSTIRPRKQTTIITALAIVALVIGSASFVASVVELRSAVRTFVSADAPPGTIVVNGTRVPVFSPPTNLVASAITIVAGALSVLLAMYLLVAGILVVRGNSHGSLLQKIFACAKIPVTIIAAFGWMWESAGSLSAIVQGGRIVESDRFVFAVTVLVGCAYPTILLIVLRSPTIRAFYLRAKLSK